MAFVKYKCDHQRRRDFRYTVVERGGDWESLLVAVHLLASSRHQMINALKRVLNANTRLARADSLSADDAAEFTYIDEVLLELSRSLERRIAGEGHPTSVSVGSSKNLYYQGIRPL